MNLFDSLVESVLERDPEIVSLRPVVEKEILHHDIVREMSTAGFLADLTFIGGTCLRSCYGSTRLSEDLDFTGGSGFDRASLSSLGHVIETTLMKKYGLPVTVGEPVRESGNVDTWKIKIITRPESPSFPAQRINIDICAIESHDKKPAMLRNHYHADFGTSGLILNAESRAEILADKVVALALRPNRVKNRDLWDIVWLTGQNVSVDYSLVMRKLDDRKVLPGDFTRTLDERLSALVSLFPDYCFELRRFLSPGDYGRVTSQPSYWEFLLSVLGDIRDGIKSFMR